MRNIQTLSSQTVRYATILAVLVGASGCTVVGDIFKAGVWVAVIGIAFLALVGFGIASLFRRS